MRNSLLIIDDSELDRAIFNEIFKKDYRVLRAATAYEGIDQVRKNVMDLAVIVLDICLQRGPNGFSVLERIHKLEGCANIPVILLTAEPEPQWVYKGVEMGAVDFLVKPLAPIATQNRIKSIIEEAWGTEEEPWRTMGKPGRRFTMSSRISKRRGGGTSSPFSLRVHWAAVNL